MKLQHQTDIDAPPSVVWTYLDDPEKIKLWMKGLVSDEPTSEGPTRVGSTFRMGIREGRKVSTYDGTILAYEPERHMRLSMTGGCMKTPMTMTVDYLLTTIAGGGTRLDYECTGEATGIWKLLSPVMKLFAGMMARGFLRTLKRVAEEEARAIAA